MRLINYHFSQAVRRAGAAFVAAKGKDPTIEGADLAELLLSGAEIGPFEREMLAELVTGEWRRRPGEAGKARELHPESTVVRMIVSSLRDKVACGIQKEAAKLEVADSYNVSRSTVEKYEKMVLERETAIENAKKGAST